MTFCSQCGHQLVDGSKYCKCCGSPVEITQESDNISLNVEISINVVLKGAANESTQVEVYLPHLSKSVAVKVPNNISLGQSLRLRGLGHISASGKQGDAYIHIVQIDYDNSVQENQKSHRKESYEGELHKCPSCGEVIAAFDAVCKSCGYEIRGRKATSVVHELFLKLEKTDEIQKKDELIRTFYIPNTREDIHEFFILAHSQIEVGGINTEAWMVKLAQAYQKAQLSFGETPEFECFHKQYSDAMQHYQKLLTRKKRREKWVAFIDVIIKILRTFGKIIALGFNALINASGMFFKLLTSIGSSKFFQTIIYILLALFVIIIVELLGI